jgi:hypothetical protein
VICTPYCLSEAEHSIGWSGGHSAFIAESFCSLQTLYDKKMQDFRKLHVYASDTRLNKKKDT